MPPQQNNTNLQQQQQQHLIMNSTEIMTDRDHHFNRSTRPLLERNRNHQHHFISDITAPRRMMMMMPSATKPPMATTNTTTTNNNTTTIKNYDNYFNIQQPQNVQLLTRKKINVVQQNNVNGFGSPSTFYNSNTINNSKNKTPNPSTITTPFCGHNDFDIIKKQYHDHESSHFGFPYGSVLQTKQSDFKFSDNTQNNNNNQLTINQNNNNNENSSIINGGGEGVSTPDDYDIDNIYENDDDDSGINVSNTNNRNFFQRQNSSSINKNHNHNHNNNNINGGSKNNNDFLKWKGSSSLKKSSSSSSAAAAVSPIDSLQQSPVFMTTKQLSKQNFSSATNNNNNSQHQLIAAAPHSPHSPPPPLPPPQSISLQNHSSSNSVENTQGPFIFGIHSNPIQPNNYFKLKHSNHCNNNNNLRNDPKGGNNNDEPIINHNQDNNDLIADHHHHHHEEVQDDDDDDDYDEINENTVIHLKNKYSKYNRRNKCDEKLTQCSVISKRNEKRVMKKTRKKEKIDKNNKNNNPKGIIKCVLVGDGAIGKTNLICSYLENRFIKEHIPTASDIYKFEVTVNESPVQVTLCDTAGQDTLDPLRELSYPDSNVFLLCFSIAQPETFQSIKLKWEPKFRKTYASIILVGTQSDLRNDPQVISKLNKYGEKPITTDDAWTFANKIGAKYLETSSLFNIGVKETFDTAIWDALVNFEEVSSSKTDGISARSLWKKLFCL